MSTQEAVILLVEDNPDDEALTLRTLNHGKVKNKIVVVRDGAEALDFLFSTGRHKDRASELFPHLVLLDLKLPKIDGLDVLRRIRADERTRLLPVVILTSSREEQDLLNGYSGGCNSYVVKPVDMKQFAESIQSLELYWMVVNQKLPQ